MWLTHIFSICTLKEVVFGKKIMPIIKLLHLKSKITLHCLLCENGLSPLNIVPLPVSTCLALRVEGTGETPQEEFPVPLGCGSMGHLRARFRWRAQSVHCLAPVARQLLSCSSFRTHNCFNTRFLQWQQLPQDWAPAIHRSQHLASNNFPRHSLSGIRSRMALVRQFLAPYRMDF